MRRSLRSSRIGARAHRLGKRLALDLRLELVEVVAVLLAELAVNRLQLLLEVELALILEERAAHVVVDLALEPQQLDLAARAARRAIEQVLGSVGDSSSALARPRGARARCAAIAERLPLVGVSALWTTATHLGRNAPVQADVFLEERDHARRASASIRSRRRPGIERQRVDRRRAGDRPPVA